MKALISLLALLGMASTAHATPVLLGTALDPTGINGLVVLGSTYDVRFSNDSYNTVFPSSSPATFLGNALGAADASIAINAVFKADGVTGLNGAACSEFPLGCLVAVTDSINATAANGWASLWSPIFIWETTIFGVGRNGHLGVNFTPGANWSATELNGSPG